MAFKPWWESPLETGGVRPGPEPGTVPSVVNPLGVPLAPVGRPSEQPVQPYGVQTSPEPVPAPQVPPVAPQAAPGQPTGSQAPAAGTQVTITTPQAPQVAPQPGVQETPVGALQPGPDGAPQVVLNPAGQEAYRRRIIRRREEFGKTPFDDDPAAPAPPVEDDGPMFNPYTNAWSGLESLDPAGEA